jgi:hypothetical protein
MNGFDCTQFQHWLDAGEATPGGDVPGAIAHAAGCPDCASLLAAERAMTTLFATPASATAAPAAALVPADFVTRVMARVALTPQPRVVPASAAASSPLAVDTLPWWIRAAARPEAAVACLLAGLAVLLAPQLLGFARMAPQWGGAALGALTVAIAPLLAPIAGRIGGDPWLGAAVALAFLPAIALVAYALYLLGMQVARVRLAPGLVQGRRA